MISKHNVTDQMNSTSTSNANSTSNKDDSEVQRKINEIQQQIDDASAEMVLERLRKERVGGRCRRYRKSHQDFHNTTSKGAVMTAIGAVIEARRRQKISQRRGSLASDVLSLK